MENAQVKEKEHGDVHGGVGYGTEAEHDVSSERRSPVERHKQYCVVYRKAMQAEKREEARATWTLASYEPSLPRMPAEDERLWRRSRMTEFLQLTRPPLLLKRDSGTVTEHVGDAAA